MAWKNLSAEKISEKKEKIMKREEKLAKKIGRFNKVSVIFIFFVICFLAVSYGADRLWFQSKNNGKQTSPDVIAAVSNASNYGLVCCGKDFTAYAGVDKGLNLFKAGKEIKLSDDSIYYINTDGQFLYYIKKADDFIYKCDMKGNESCVVSSAANRLMLCGDRLYFINVSDGNKLYATDKDGKTKPESITENAISKYVVIDDGIYFLRGNSLYSLRNNTKQEHLITSYAEDFWYNGNLVILNNGRLIVKNPIDEKEKISVGSCDTAVGMDSENIYFVRDGELWSGSDDGENERKILNGSSIYKAVYRVGSKLYCYALEKDENGKYINKFLEIDIEADNNVLS